MRFDRHIAGCAFLIVLPLGGCSGLFFPVQPAAFVPPTMSPTATARPASKLPAGREVYADMITRHAKEAGVPPAVAVAVVQVESNYNPNTQGRHGEIGLMQIKYDTARDLGYDGTAAELYDPETNLRFGMKYLAAAQKVGGGELCGMMFKYQAGLYATELKPSNIQYCDRVRAAMGQG